MMKSEATMGSDTSPTPAQTQQDEIYTTLRQWFSLGRFAPGERLKIRDLAALMGSGIMPVRAALQRLCADGAVVNIPNAGVAVPRLSQVEFDDLLKLRMLLEGEAAERGSALLGAAGKQTLQALLHTMDKALNDADAKAYLAANDAFHVLLYKAAGSPLLFGLIDTLWLKAGPISNRLFDAADSLKVLNHAHTELVAALAKGDHYGVRQAVEKDIFVAGQYIRRALSHDRKDTTSSTSNEVQG